MHKIFREKIDKETIDGINRILDTAEPVKGFEILIPPQSEEVLSGFKNAILSQCSDIRWDDKTYAVIRTVTEKGNRASQAWHFDNQRETALVVLKSVDGENNGDILVRPDLRNSPKSIFMYVATKLFWTNPITWFIFRRKSLRDRFFTRIPLKAGDVMIFDGSTTYHGNLPIASGVRRSILLHSDNLFEGSWITKLFYRLNKLYFYKN